MHNTVFPILAYFVFSIRGLRFRGFEQALKSCANWFQTTHPQSRKLRGIAEKQLFSGVTDWTSCGSLNLFGRNKTQLQSLRKEYSSSDVNGVPCKCCYPPQRSLHLWWMMHTATFIIHTMSTTISPAFSGITHQYHLEIWEKTNL